MYGDYPSLFGRLARRQKRNVMLSHRQVVVNHSLVIEDAGPDRRPVPRLKH